MDLVQRMRGKTKAMQERKLSYELQCKEGSRQVEDMTSKQREYLQQFHHSFLAQVANFITNEQITRKRVETLAYEKDEMESWKTITLRVMDMQMKANEQLASVQRKIKENRLQNERWVKEIEEDESRVKGNCGDVFKEEYLNDGRRIRFDSGRNGHKKGIFIDEKGEKLRIIVQKQKPTQTLEQAELVQYQLRYNSTQNKYVACGQYPTPILKAISHFNFHKRQQILQKDLQGICRYS